MGFVELDSDLTRARLLELWEAVPTPDMASRIREATVVRRLKRNRIRRFEAAHVLGVLRQTPVTVAQGTAEAAQAHIATLDRAYSWTSRSGVAGKAQTQRAA